MEMSDKRKNAALAGLIKAHKDGIQYKEIGEVIGVPAGALRTFVAKGKLGQERLKTLLAWLTREGYIEAEKKELFVLEANDVAEMIADRLAGVVKILRSDVDINIKSAEFTAVIKYYHGLLDTFLASLQKSKN